MKIQLETIPVWDGVKEGSECFICSLMKKAEEDGVRYYLSSAVMTPEIRVETNRDGFCPHHFHLLAEGGKPQSLALVMDTYYEESKGIYARGFERIADASNPRKLDKAVSQFFESVRGREKGCLICSRMEERLVRYCYTVAALWKEDPEFRKALEASNGFCIHHTEELYRMAKEALSGDDLVEYGKLLFSLLSRNLDRVQHDDWWMTQKYKSENKDKPWNGCEDAQKRAVYKLIGEGRVIDPVRK